MNIYTSHPFDFRREFRKWELHIESKFEVELINPFYDIHRDDVKLIDEEGITRYELLDHKEVVERDIAAIKDSDAVITVISGHTSYGTPMEMVYARIYHKPNYLVCMSGREGHPWLKYFSSDIFLTLDELEDNMDYVLNEISEAILEIGGQDVGS